MLNKRVFHPIGVGLSEQGILISFLQNRCWLVERWCFINLSYPQHLVKKFIFLLLVFKTLQVLSILNTGERIDI